MDAKSQQQRWVTEASRLGGKDPLLNFKPTSHGQVDLTKAHPGGLAQLVSSRSGRIINLVRDGVSQTRAISATRRVMQRAQRLSESLGIQTSFISAGSIVFPGEEEQQLPMLLWPVQIVAKGDDYEIELAQHCILNPYFESWIMNLGGMESVTSLRGLAFASIDLLPYSYLERVYQILDRVDVRIERQLYLGNFAPDLCYVASWRPPSNHPLLSVLAGDRIQIDQSPESTPAEDGVEHSEDLGLTTIDQTVIEGSLSERADELPPPNILVANADRQQQRALRLQAAGKSFAVETLPGCGYLQLVVNMAASNAFAGRRTLIVAPRRQTLDELAERFAEVQLPGLGLRLHEPWIDAIASISRFEKAQPAQTLEAEEGAKHAQQEVEAYLAGVQAESPELGIGLVQALRKLAELSGSAEPPTNSARIAPAQLRVDPEQAIELLKRAHMAKLFEIGEKDSPWFDARFSNQSEITHALQIAGELAGRELEDFRYRVTKYLSEQNLRPVDSVLGWGQQIELLLDVRDTLDRFQPEVFEHQLAEMIEATSPRGESSDFSGAQRRRYKKLAKEFLRPGASVPNLHDALVNADRQRQAWIESCIVDQPPKVPLGLVELDREFRVLLSQLAELQGHLGLNPDGQLLVELSLDELKLKLTALSTNTEYLSGLIERDAIWKELEGLGLLELGRQLTSIHPSPERLLAEYELSWWQSALQVIIASDPRVLEFDAESANQVEQKYITAQEALMSQARSALSYRQAQKWKSAISQNPEQANQLRTMLKARNLFPAQVAGAAGQPWQTLSNVILASPYQLQQLDSNERFDVVFVLDAAGSGMAEIARSIVLANQVVAFGDPVISAAENFETVVRPFAGDSDQVRQSVFQLVAARFGSIDIHHSYRMQGQVLARYLNQEFYQNRITFLPARGEYFGERNFELVHIRNNTKATSSIEGATESMDSEVSKTVELILAHARWHPEESLLVASASRVHADRVQQALEKELARQPQLNEFFEAHGRERFEVVSLADMSHRLADRVIFSLGFGRNQEGGVSSQLGALSSALAEKRLANLIVSARNRITVVSCYAAPDFQSLKPGDPMNHLAELHSPQVIDSPQQKSADSLLRDLALRLQKLGLTARISYAASVPLAVSFGNKAAVIDPDWSMAEGDLDEQIRLRPALLRGMGWQFIRVRAFELFANPQSVAENIAGQLGFDPVRVAEPVSDGWGETDSASSWGDRSESNDWRLREEKPPHWG